VKAVRVGLPGTALSSSAFTREKYRDRGPSEVAVVAAVVPCARSTRVIDHEAGVWFVDVLPAVELFIWGVGGVGGDDRLGVAVVVPCSDLFGELLSSAVSTYLAGKPKLS
jgi:hypothetical protein